MRSRPLLTLLPFAVAASSVVLGACSDSADTESGLDSAADRITELEDTADELGRLLTTTSTTVPPPVTQSTAPPTTHDPDAPRPTTTTVPIAAPAITAASTDAILGLVGAASWDAGLPIPSDCIATGSFTPSGEAGINGGVITCSVDAPLFQVDEFFRFALTRGGFPFNPSSSGNGFRITIADAATISGTASGDRTSLTIEQRFA